MKSEPGSMRRESVQTQVIGGLVVGIEERARPPVAWRMSCNESGFIIAWHGFSTRAKSRYSGECMGWKPMPHIQSCGDALLENPHGFFDVVEVLFGRSNDLVVLAALARDQYNVAGAGVSQ